MTEPINKYSDVIDSRAVIARIAELEEKRDSTPWTVEWMPDGEAYSDWEVFDSWEEGRDFIISVLEAKDTPTSKTAIEQLRNMDVGESVHGLFVGKTEWSLFEDDHALCRLDAAEIEELDALLELRDEASYSQNWEYGETLVHDAYFKEYAQNLARDCGILPDDLQWPVDCIDWNQAVRELQVDYMAVEYMEQVFWIHL